uniref:3'-5' exonuclease domain-containing protein n=1 Tax=Fagus sylvatica TaxID=28930 RepID=A0A2N9FJW8_FAGSY
MIPISVLFKICMYEIEIQGVYVKASVVDRAVLVDAHIAELRSSFEKSLLYYLDSFPDSIKKVLSDKNVCFVGIGVKDKVKKILQWPQMFGCKTGVELGHLAARVLKKPNLDECGLVELASEVGVYYEEPKSVTFSDWGARVFSNEQVKYAIHDAYASYLIANNLLSLL